MADVLTPEQRRRNMSRIKSKDTKAEIMLRRALWDMGVRYRKNYRMLPGTPDIVLTKNKIAIFVDGDFWHGRIKAGKSIRPKTNTEFWTTKLERNIERDKEINDELTEIGYLVLRFWETDVKKDVNECVKKILEYI